MVARVWTALRTHSEWALKTCKYIKKAASLNKQDINFMWVFGFFWGGHCITYCINYTYCISKIYHMVFLWIVKELKQLIETVLLGKDFKKY